MNNLNHTMKRKVRFAAVVFTFAMLILSTFAFAQGQLDVVMENDVVTLMDYAVSEEKNGNVDTAVLVYRRILSIDPHHFEANYIMGKKYAQDGDHEEAIKYFKNAVYDRTDHAQVYFHLSESYRKLSMYNEQVLALKEAIKVKPDYSEALSSLALRYHNMGRYTEASRLERRAVKLNH